MRPRVLHLAWLLVLLSSVSAANAGVPAASGRLSCTAHYHRMLHSEQASTPFVPVGQRAGTLPSKYVQSAGEVVFRAAWGMRPPVAQALSLYAATSLAAA